MSTNNLMSTYNTLTKKSVDRVNALGDLNLKTAETVATRQVDVMSLLMEQGLRMMTLASEAKGYTDLYKGQVEISKDVTEQLVQESKNGMKLAGQIRDDYRGWFDAALAEVKDSNATVRNAVTA